MKNYKNLIYVLLCLSFSIIIGAAVYEHLAVWPRAFLAPPKSLSMFQGEFGLYTEPFWAKIHPATLLLFIIVLLSFWKTERRKFIVIPFAGYLMVMIATFTYFVPELVDLVGTTYSDSIDPELVQRGSRWEILSILRLILIVILAIILFWGLTKSNQKLSEE